MIPVYWLWLNEEPHNGFWDWGLIKEMLNKSDYSFDHRHTSEIEQGDFGIVVVPGAAHYGKVEKVNRQLAKLGSCIVFVTSDEERRLLLSELKHHKMKVWLSYGRNTDQNVTFLPLGAPDGFTPTQSDSRPLTAYFKGQTPTVSRTQLIRSMSQMKNVECKTTEGFGQGMKGDYAYGLSHAKFAPAPHGTVHPDSFRLYEALESGAVPIVQQDPYWRLVNGDYLVVEDWSNLEGNIREWIGNWKMESIKRSYAWMWTKRNLRKYLEDDIEELSNKKAGQKITALIATSPIKSHPSTEIIEETIKSVRDRLPRSEIIIMCDGVRETQGNYRDRYEDYQLNLFWVAKKYDCMILRSDEHRHQAGMTAAALQLVDTPQILFMEHDTPLCESIPFEAISEVISDGELDVVRFHFESHILPPHRHLSRGAFRHNGIPYARTVQWSQRPHLASTDYYKRIIKQNFIGEKGEIKKTMIEDKMHGVAQEHENEHRLAFYRPKGDMKRSYHTDGREDDSKFEEEFEL